MLRYFVFYVVVAKEFDAKTGIPYQKLNGQSKIVRVKIGADIGSISSGTYMPVRNRSLNM
jgi:hypothetical protein